MTKSEPDFIKLISNISDNETFKTEVAQIKSKALFKEVSQSYAADRLELCRISSRKECHSC